jgi:hypothetical protein
MNMMPPPMPVPALNQPMPMQQGAAPVAPMTRSNAGRRRRFGDRLESMLASNQPPVASDQMGDMNVFTGQMLRRQMPRRQMMGGTAMQPPVRRMMGGGSVPIPRETDIYGQPHMLAYINPTEASLLEGLGGMGTPGPGGVPQYNFFTDFFNAITGGGKSSNTGGRNNPRGSSSSSSQSYTQPSNDPYAENRGGSSTRSTNILDTPSQSTSKANKALADSMIAGGGGTNLSGSGSTAMDKLLADQKAQTQNDSSSNQTAVGTNIDPGLKNVMDLAKQREQEYLDSLKSQAAAEAAVGLDPFGGAGPDVTPTADPLDPFGGPGPDITPTTSIFDVDPIFNADPEEDFNLGTGTTYGDTYEGGQVVKGGGGTDSGVNLDPPVEQVYYDMFGNPYKTQAEANAADAEHLRKQQAAADAEAAAEAERLRMEQLAQLEAEAAAEAARAQAERERIALQAIPDELMTEPFNNANVTPTSLPDELSGVPFNTTQERVVDALQNIPDELTTTEFNNAINLGLGDPDATKDNEEEDDRGFLEKLVDDITAVPGNILRDLKMGFDAGFYKDLDEAEENLRNAKNPDGSRKYTDKEIEAWRKATEKTMKDQKDQRERESAQDDDDGPINVVDPCPTGFKLDPVSGICVPIEDTEDTKEEEDSGDDKEEDTSDDELRGVVRLPPPPTSYLDNAPIMMKRGGSVGLNRAADNFLAAMGG